MFDVPRKERLKLAKVLFAIGGDKTSKDFLTACDILYTSQDITFKDLKDVDTPFISKNGFKQSATDICTTGGASNRIVFSYTRLGESIVTLCDSEQEAKYFCTNMNGKRYFRVEYKYTTIFGSTPLTTTTVKYVDQDNIEELHEKYTSEGFRLVETERLFHHEWLQSKINHLEKAWALHDLYKDPEDIEALKKEILETAYTIQALSNYYKINIPSLCAGLLADDMKGEKVL